MACLLIFSTLPSSLMLPKCLIASFVFMAALWGKQIKLSIRLDPFREVCFTLSNTRGNQMNKWIAKRGAPELCSGLPHRADFRCGKWVHAPADILLNTSTGSRHCQRCGESILRNKGDS